MCGGLHQMKGNFYTHFITIHQRLHEEEGYLVPGNNIGAYLHHQDKNLLAGLKWGFPIGEKLIYNARRETVLEKSLFQDIYERRCIVPVSRFEEKGVWFKDTEDPTIGIAGLWRRQKDCCILTKQANPTVQIAHHRMPLILPQAQWEKWLYPKLTRKELEELVAT